MLWEKCIISVGEPVITFQSKWWLGETFPSWPETSAQECPGTLLSRPLSLFMVSRFVKTWLWTKLKFVDFSGKICRRLVLCCQQEWSPGRRGEGLSCCHRCFCSFTGWIYSCWMMRGILPLSNIYLARTWRAFHPPWTLTLALAPSSWTPPSRSWFHHNLSLHCHIPPSRKLLLSFIVITLAPFRQDVIYQHPSSLPLSKVFPSCSTLKPFQQHQAGGNCRSCFQPQGFRPEQEPFGSFGRE